MTLMAALHLDPLETYRVATVALIAALLFMTSAKGAVSKAPVHRGASIILLSDLKWLLAYFQAEFGASKSSSRMGSGRGHRQRGEPRKLAAVSRLNVSEGQSP